eukprot:NODE_536_length_6333_cov_0.998877.p5 type:complete len:240 gc:universal NODE_536_length_6333_cov_0.998877:974-1693(+)
MKRIHSDYNVLPNKKAQSISGFQLAMINFTLGIEPIYMGNFEPAIKKHLSKWLGKYQSKLGGWCLTYYEGKSRSKICGTLSDSPNIYVNCEAKCLMFFPKIETEVRIKVVSSSPHHIGGLFLGFIHISIPKDYIPERYEFKYDNAISGKWTNGNISYGMGDILDCSLIGMKQDGHDMMLIATISDDREEIQMYIKAYTPNYVPFDEIGHSDSDSSSSESDNSSDTSGSLSGSSDSSSNK